MKAPDGEVLRETLDRLRLEVAELRASRERLVLAADDDRRAIERELHDGVHQHLIALAVNLQLVSGLADTDLPEAKALLDQMGRDVAQALKEVAELAQRIHPPLVEAHGLGAALRAAATSAAIPASIEVRADSSYPPEVSSTVFACCLASLEHAGAGAKVTVRDKEGALTFEVTANGAASATPGSLEQLERLRDRVEALGGRLTIHSAPGPGTRVSGSLPLCR